jgi:predicted neuraminidase
MSTLLRNVWMTGMVTLGGFLVSCSTYNSAPTTTATPTDRAVAQPEFIYETAPFPSCHASTIEEIPGGVIAAWFGGTAEKNPDVGIWVARKLGEGAWTPPVEVVNGVQPGGKRHPCWNPVLFQPKTGPLQLYYKVGPSPSTWWGMLMTSSDGGKTWSEPRRLPDGILGPIKNKPVQLDDGTILSPSSTEHDGWRIHVERSRDLGKTWTKSEPLNDGKQFGAIQPTVLLHGKGRLQMLCRSRQNVVTECWSEDNGVTWGPMKATSLPNPSSGVDGVTLADGRHLLVYNPVTRGRSPLVIGVSRDGRSWQTALTLEDQPGEYSYPAIMQAKDGRVHVTYTWKRQKIRHWSIDPARLNAL